ncbi:MAG: hypothetical protein NVSMB51_12280 [Solirubrobacteraceae bacterium]
MRICRQRSLQTTPERAWAVACEADHLPRWWPRVVRVEAADEHGFTQVLRSERGKTVRADYRIAEHDPPRRVRWVQELEGTPFERLLSRSELAIELASGGEGATIVTLELTRTMRGLSRFGGFMNRRAGSRQLDEALANLERVCG